jgi:hypothetical protein
LGRRIVGIEPPPQDERPMSLIRSIMTLAVATTACLLVWRVVAQDNPILRERLAQKIVEELSKHDAEERAWYNEKSVNKQSWTSGKILGKPIRLASWTEESKSWVWLVDPKTTLNVELRHLAIREGRVEFALSTAALARFKASGRIPKFAKTAVGGTVRMEVEIAGSAALSAGTLADAKITTFEGVLHDIQFNNDLAHPLEDLVKDALNAHVRKENAKFRASLERAIERVRF